MTKFKQKLEKVLVKGASSSAVEVLGNFERERMISNEKDLLLFMVPPVCLEPLVCFEAVASVG